MTTNDHTNPGSHLMLSDRDRRELLQIQRHLCADDPDFAESFGAIQRPPRRDRDRHAYTTWIIVAASLLGVLSLVIGTPSSAVAFAAVALVAAALRFRDADQGRNT